MSELGPSDGRAGLRRRKAIDAASIGARLGAAVSFVPGFLHETIVRYFGGAGVGVGASSRMTIPAGVRSDSNGVVSGVGGAGAGVAFSAAWWPSDAGEPQEIAAPATRAAARETIVLVELLKSPPNRGGFYRQIDKYCRSARKHAAAS